MRNLFDQYTQPENRLTHALVWTLNADRALLRPFLEWTGVHEIPGERRLRITEQQIPGEVISGDEEEGRGLPDACVFDDDGWALLVEAKVQADVSPDQLRRHVATARRHGFERPFVLLISVDHPPTGLPHRALHRAWRDVYAWFRQRARISDWARTFTTYMEVFESHMIASDYSIRGTLTMFDGLRFDEENRYTYREGKRLIRLLGDELQRRGDLHKIGVDPQGTRRSAITGQLDTAVWDFLPLKAARRAGNFTAFPHLTMVLRQTDAEAAITIPNGVRGGFRTKLRAIGEDGFFELLTKIERRVRPILRRLTGSKSTVYALQRHYRSQRSAGEMDARLEADLRTILPGRRREAKYQPEWMRAIYDVATRKRSNIQMGFVVRFPYSCSAVRSPAAVGLFAEAWKALSPIIAFVRDEER